MIRLKKSIKIVGLINTRVSWNKHKCKRHLQTARYAAKKVSNRVIKGDEGKEANHSAHDIISCSQVLKLPQG